MPLNDVWLYLLVINPLIGERLLWGLTFHFLVPSVPFLCLLFPFWSILFLDLEIEYGGLILKVMQNLCHISKNLLLILVFGASQRSSVLEQESANIFCRSLNCKYFRWCTLFQLLSFAVLMCKMTMCKWIKEVFYEKKFLQISMVNWIYPLGYDQTMF